MPEYKPEETAVIILGDLGLNYYKNKKDFFVTKRCDLPGAWRSHRKQRLFQRGLSGKVVIQRINTRLGDHTGANRVGRDDTGLPSGFGDAGKEDLLCRLGVSGDKALTHLVVALAIVCDI